MNEIRVSSGDVKERKSVERKFELEQIIAIDKGFRQLLQFKNPP